MAKIDLEIAERNVRVCIACVARQRALVEQLQSRGGDITQATRLLSIFEEMLVDGREQLTRLRRASETSDRDPVKSLRRSPHR